MRAAWLGATLAALAAGCVGSASRGGRVETEVVAEGGGLRACFRRNSAQPGERPARLVVAGGRVAEVVHSPDLLTVSVLWLEPSGTLECIFPGGASGTVDARAATGEGRWVEYVFWEAREERVTARLPRSCPMRASLPLRVSLAPASLPARLHLPSDRSIGIVGANQGVALALGTDRRGVLDGRDLDLAIETSNGSRFRFLVGVDPDGTPVTTTGYVRESESGR